MSLSPSLSFSMPLFFVHLTIPNTSDYLFSLGLILIVFCFVYTCISPSLFVSFSLYPSVCPDTLFLIPLFLLFIVWCALHHVSDCKAVRLRGALSAAIRVFLSFFIKPSSPPPLAFSSLTNHHYLALYSPLFRILH